MTHLHDASNSHSNSHAIVGVGSLPATILDFAAGDTIVRDGSPRTGLYIVREGWVFRYRLLADGRRLVTRFLMPGDIIGLQSLFLGRLNAAIAALSRCRLALVTPDDVARSMQTEVAIGIALLQSAAEHERALEMHMLTLGRRTAIERVAWLATDLIDRGDRAGLVSGERLQAPISQLLIADALGLSLVHVNKTLARMESSGIMTWARGVMHVHDRPGLAALAAIH